MKLRTTFESYRPAKLAWACIDDDTYDGAPDADALAHIIGYGDTKAAAIRDWHDQFNDWSDWVDYEYDKAAKEQGRRSDAKAGFDD